MYEIIERSILVCNISAVNMITNKLAIENSGFLHKEIELFYKLSCQFFFNLSKHIITNSPVSLQQFIMNLFLNIISQNFLNINNLKKKREKKRRIY